MPATSAFRMIAVGPIFPEQPTMAAHVPIRDEVAAQEVALAGLLLSRGYTVMGKHPAPRHYYRGLIPRVVELISAEFP